MSSSSLAISRITEPVVLPSIISAARAAGAAPKAISEPPADRSLDASDERDLPSADVMNGRGCGQRTGPTNSTNRVREILWHIPWYGFKTQARLAQDSGISPAAVSRLLRGESQPSLAVAMRLTRALSRRLGRPLDVSEVFSLDGSYPTPSVCHLTGCRNCLPPTFYDDQEEIRPDFRDIKAGEWSATVAPSAKKADTTSSHSANNPRMDTLSVSKTKGGL
jgi:transcriptional regulator with XRE-family HTH domain